MMDISLKLSQAIAHYQNVRSPKKHRCCYGSVCQLFGAVGVLAPIQGVVLLIHGPRSCAHFVSVTHPKATVVSDNLKDTEVVFGGNEKLKRALLEVENLFKPKLIVVLSTCISEIIGDDVLEITNLAKNQSKAKVLAIEVAGFTEDHQSYGASKAYVALTEIMESAACKLDKSINIIGETIPFLFPDRQELTRILSRIEVKVHKIITAGLSVDDMASITQAELMVARCPVTPVDACNKIEKKFGVPWIAPPIPIGLSATKQWLMEVGKFFGIENRAEQVIQNEEEKIRGFLKKEMAFLRGKRVLVSSGIGRAPSLASFALDLEADDVFVACQKFRDEITDAWKWVSRIHNVDPEVIFEPEYEDIENAINEFKPDLILGDELEKPLAFSHGIPIFSQMYYIAPHMGYRGFSKMVKQIHRTLQSRHSVVNNPDLYCRKNHKSPFNGS